MHLSRFLTRPPAVFALTLFGLLPLAWKASEAAPEHATPHTHLRTQIVVRSHDLLHSHSTLRSHDALRPHGATAGGPPTAIPLYTFTGIPDGLEPQGGLLQTSDGSFYGVTTRGGSFGFGSIYRLTPDGKVTVLASFPQTQGGPKYPSGPLVEGLNPDGTPSGAFYGVTEYGGDTGNSGKGTVYLFAADGGSPTGFSITRLYSFTGGADGGLPLGALTVGRKADGTPDGYLYGTTSSGGGASGGGVVFRVPKDGLAEDVLHTFLPIDSLGAVNNGGSQPRAALLQRHDATGWGRFFGTTAYGGAGGGGTVFSLTSAGEFVTLHDFQDSPNGRDGQDPEAGLVQSADGALYGTTFGGGNGAGGTVYRLAPDAGSSTKFTYSQIVSMGIDTRFPKAALIEASDGKLYGTSEQGGASSSGSVFRIDADPASPTGYSATALHVFTYTESGGTADGDLVQGTDGDLYGVTASGGTNTDGTIYRLNVVPAKKAPAPTIASTKYLVADDGSFQLVTIQGDHFVKGAGVTVDGTAAQSVNFVDATNLGGFLGHLLSAGDHTVVVTNPDGQSASAVLTTLDAPTVKGATALTDATGDVFLLVTGSSFGTPGYNGAPDGTSVNVKDSNGSIIKATTVLVPPATPAQPGGPQDVIAALDTTGAAPGPFTVTITNPDNQSSQSQTFEVYPFDQTEYAISVDPSLLAQAYQLYLQSKGTPPPGPTSNALKGQGRAGRTSFASGPPQISPPIGYQVNSDGTATLTINGTNFKTGAKASITNTFVGTIADAFFPSDDVAHDARLDVTVTPALPAGDHTVTVINPDGQTASATLSVFPSSPTQVVLGTLSFGVPVPRLDITAGGTSGIATAATGLISQDGAGLLSQAGIVSHDSGGLVASGGGNLITQDGAGIVSHDSGGIVSHDSGGLVATGGGNVVSNDGGSIRERKTRGARPAAATNSVAVTGLVADIASDAGHSGSLGLTPQFGQAALARLKAHALPNAPLTFLLTKHDAGPARGKGATDLTASLNYADGTSALLLDLRVTPGQPDVVVYQAPGVTLKPRGTTPPPTVSSLAPTLTALTPSTAKAGSPDLTLTVTGTLFEAGTVVNWNGKPLATQVLSGTQATATVPAALLSAAGTAQVTVTNPAPGGGASTALPFVVTPATPLHTFPAGLQMLSVTEDYAGLGLSAALSDSSHVLMAWNPATAVYETRTDLRPGAGYWTRLSKPTDLRDTGTLAPTNAPFAIPLQAGWNMIGDPFPTPVALASLTVRDAIGTQGTFRQAVSGGVVSGALYAYPAGATQYQQVGQDGSLTPFDGEWVYAFRACTLLVPAH